MQTEGTSKLVQDSQIEHLQLILQSAQGKEVSIDETTGIAYDLITFYELLAEEEYDEQARQ